MKNIESSKSVFKALIIQWYFKGFSWLTCISLHACIIVIVAHNHNDSNKCYAHILGNGWMIICVTVTERFQKLIYLHLFTDCFHENFSSIVGNKYSCLFSTIHLPYWCIKLSFVHKALHWTLYHVLFRNTVELLSVKVRLCPHWILIFIKT